MCDSGCHSESWIGACSPLWEEAPRKLDGCTGLASAPAENHGVDTAQGVVAVGHVRLALGDADADVPVLLAQDHLAVEAPVHPIVDHRLRGERAAGHLAEAIAPAGNRIARVDDAVLQRLLAVAAVIKAVLSDHHVGVLLSHLRERPDLFDLLHVRLAPLLADQAEDGLAELIGGGVPWQGIGVTALCSGGLLP